MVTNMLLKMFIPIKKKKKIFETWFVKNSVKFETIEYKDWVKK